MPEGDLEGADFFRKILEKEGLYVSLIDHAVPQAASGPTFSIRLTCGAEFARPLVQSLAARFDAEKFVTYNAADMQVCIQADWLFSLSREERERLLSMIIDQEKKARNFAPVTVANTLSDVFQVPVRVRSMIVGINGFPTPLEIVFFIAEPLSPSVSAETSAAMNAVLTRSGLPEIQTSVCDDTIKLAFPIADYQTVLDKALANRTSLKGLLASAVAKTASLQHTQHSSDANSRSGRTARFLTAVLARGRRALHL